MAKEFEQFSLEPRPMSRNTVNNVPVDLLDGHLPPPEPCPDCAYPTWFLAAPDTVTTTGVGQMAVFRSEYQRRCLEPKSPLEAISPQCGHPYHLVPHGPCQRGRLHPVFPDGLIVRVPRVGGIND